MEVPVFWLQKSCPALCERGEHPSKSCLWGCGAERPRIQYVCICALDLPRICVVPNHLLVCCTYDSVLCSCVCVCVDYNWERRATLGVTSVGFHEWKRHAQWQFNYSALASWQIGESKLLHSLALYLAARINAGHRLEWLLPANPQN